MMKPDIIIKQLDNGCFDVQIANKVQTNYHLMKCLGLLHN